jgi:hypothetical protein
MRKTLESKPVYLSQRDIGRLVTSSYGSTTLRRSLRRHPRSSSICTRKGSSKQDKHYDAMRPEVNPSVLHAYGLACATGGDKSLFHARTFLSTRASLFNKPDIGDNFIATLEGKDAVARVKAVNELFAGADNTAIGNLGEAIALDVMLMLGAQAVAKHPIPTHHYNIIYFMGPTASPQRSQRPQRPQRPHHRHLRADPDATSTGR